MIDDELKRRLDGAHVPDVLTAKMFDVVLKAAPPGSFVRAALERAREDLARKVPMTPAQEARCMVMGMVMAGHRKGRIAKAVGVTSVAISRWLAQARTDDGADGGTRRQRPTGAALAALRLLLAAGGPEQPTWLQCIRPIPIEACPSMDEIRAGTDDQPGPWWVDSPCWAWRRAMQRRTRKPEHGTIYLRGHGLYFVHRVAWAAVHGQIPPELLVLHTCDFKPCVNPSHLYIGTSKDNSRDRVLRRSQQPRP